ncbi:MAG: carboxypeptidase-like regulatory domain-containing protein [Acidobacteria bacterium]|nr:carboxypeptidase-like regulatory domain-containing protein [Acidobacteriota bacterium]
MKFFRPTARSRISRVSLLLLLSVGLSFSPAASAQSNPTGSLTGVVQDSNGAAVPAALTTVRNVGTGLTRAAVADGEGRWTVPALPVGRYEVLIEAQGFKRTALKNVEVEASVPRTLDARLEIGDIAGEVVNVTSAGLAVTTPDTSAVSRQLTSDQLVSIPTSTRSFTQLLSAEAGVNTASSSTAWTPPTSPPTKAH